MKNYENPHCFGEKEFLSDLKRIDYINKLFLKYRKHGILKERLILNHIIILNNVFGPVHVSRILFFRCDKYHSELKPFLVMLNLVGDTVTGVNGQTIDVTKIKNDEMIEECLRKI